MADLSRTVSIIFEAEDKASKAVGDVEQKLKDLDGTSATSGTAVGGVGESIDDLGASAGKTVISAGDLGEKLRDLARDAGLPKPALEAIDGVLLRIGGPVTGTAVVAAGALAAFALVMFNAGGDADTFKTRLTNLGESAGDADEAFDFVLGTVKDLETNLADTLDAYAKFLVKLDGTDIPAKVAEDAFAGITKAVKSQGGELKDTEKLLDDFVEAAADGEIDLKDLDKAINDIPGGLRIFAEALDVPIEDLKTLAENGKLGKEEIEKFATALNEQEYKSITPVKDAFVDLWNTLKDIALDVGAETGFNAVMWLLEEAIRAITVAVTLSGGLLVAFGETLANIAFTIANWDFEGFGERQQGIFDKFGTSVGGATDKLLGIEEAAKEADTADAAKNYKELADQVGNVGDESEKTTTKTDDLATAQNKAEKSAVDLEKAVADTETALAKQAEEARKAKEDMLKFEVAMEEIASNERIKTMEFAVNLDIAQLEEQTKRIEAAFESIDTTIESTGDVIGGLFGALGEVGGFYGLEQLELIEKQLELENKRRQDALDLQKELTKANIDNINAQTKAIERDTAMIQIDGAGLQPHLEAFMWEILKAIQTRVNRDGYKFLLGT